jgi:hypothetical protein
MYGDAGNTLIDWALVFGGLRGPGGGTKSPPPASGSNSAPLRAPASGTATASSGSRGSTTVRGGTPGAVGHGATNGVVVEAEAIAPATPVTPLNWTAVVPKKGTICRAAQKCTRSPPQRRQPSKTQSRCAPWRRCRMTNEAWARAHALGRTPDAAGNLTIPMGRVVGDAGGQAGAAARAAGQSTELRSITIHVRPGTNEIIAGYPTP